jgi:hypothetical protein
MKNLLNHLKFWAEDYIAILAPLTLVVLILGGIVGLRFGLGLFPFGPEQEIAAKVQRLYVDVSGSKDSTSSHYMVGTDKGVFEVSNSLWLWMWDADKRYSQLETDKEFKLKVKGNELINIIFQEYPRILSVTPIQQNQNPK